MYNINGLSSFYYSGESFGNVKRVFLDPKEDDLTKTGELQVIMQHTFILGLSFISISPKKRLLSFSQVKNTS